MNDQRRQLEKESAVRLELEDKIMTHMQQKLTHNKAAKYSQRLTSKIAALKKEKVKMGFRKKHSEYFRLLDSNVFITITILFNIYSIFLDLQFQSGPVLAKGVIQQFINAPP